MSAGADGAREIGALPQAAVAPASRSDREIGARRPAWARAASPGEGIRGWENAMSACADSGREIGALPQAAVAPASRSDREIGARRPAWARAASPGE
jgi:hypothetical protein